jgi:hypothetical protein
MPTIGRRNTLKIIREAPPGLYLHGGKLGEILLPHKYIPANLKPTDLLNVFIYLDSEDRLVATTETPLAEVGEFAALKVVGVNRNVGFKDGRWWDVAYLETALQGEYPTSVQPPLSIRDLKPDEIEAILRAHTL